jgi:hypothetical protein
LGWLGHPKNPAWQPFEVVSPQNPGDHEILSISWHVGLHVIFSSIWGIGHSSCLRSSVKWHWTGQLFSSNHNAWITLDTALGHWCKDPLNRWRCFAKHVFDMLNSFLILPSESTAYMHYQYRFQLDTPILEQTVCALQLHSSDQSFLLYTCISKVYFANVITKALVTHLQEK